jgi:ParB-like chromosome segregation protein Spo0J
MTVKPATVIDRQVVIEKLQANPRNPRLHPDEQIKRLAASLRRDGQTKPLLARKANHMLIAGHGVHRAALQLGWTTLQVRLLDVDQPTADRIMLADNRFSDLSSNDNDRVAELLREIEEDDWAATGFSDAEAEKLLGEFEEGEIAVREVATGTVADTFWIAVRGPLPQQADVLGKLKQLLGQYPEVEVTIGTVDVDEIAP